MLVVRHDSPITLLQRAGEFLRRDEAENNLILGICGSFTGGRAGDVSRLWLLTIENDGSVIGVAVMSPPRNIVITRLSQAAMDRLVEYLFEAEASFPGVAGPSPHAAEFAERWSQKVGRRRLMYMDQRIYACQQVQSVRFAQGHLRQVTLADKDLLVEWSRDFHVAVHAEDAIDRCEGLVESLIAAKSVFIWEDNGPVSCAAVTRETDKGVAIFFVYTPPSLCRRGYATSCVAALTQRLLESGKAFCCLYTDLTNATSNHIYQQIGYQPVCDAQMWTFSKE